MDKMREEFEAWAESFAYDLRIGVVDGINGYLDEMTQGAWMGWQAARQSAGQERGEAGRRAFGDKFLFSYYGNTKVGRSLERLLSRPHPAPSGRVSDQQPVAWVTDADVCDFGKGPGESAFMFAPSGKWNVPLYAHPPAAAARIADSESAAEAQLAHFANRIAALESQLAELTADRDMWMRRTEDTEQEALAARAQLTESREREGRMRELVMGARRAFAWFCGNWDRGTADQLYKEYDEALAALAAEKGKK